MAALARAHQPCGETTPTERRLTGMKGIAATQEELGLEHEPKHEHDDGDDDQDYEV